MSNAPHLPTTFDGWVEFLRAGNLITVPVHDATLQRRLRGNRQVFIGTVVVLAAMVACLVWLVAGDFGRLATYILASVFIALLVALLVYIRRLRRRLDVAAIHPHYLVVGRRAIVVANSLDLLWDQTVGVVSVNLLHEEPRGFGARMAHRAGSTRAEVVIGLAKSTGKAVKQAADPRLRILLDAFSDCGSIRIPLDAVLRDDHTRHVLLAVTAAAHLAGLESLISGDRAAIAVALRKVMSSMPPVSEWDMWAPRDTTESTPDPAPTPASAAATPPPPSPRQRRQFRPLRTRR